MGPEIIKLAKEGNNRDLKIKITHYQKIKKERQEAIEQNQNNSQSGKRALIQLISKRFELDYVDEYAWTPLHYACCEGHLECVKLLIETAGVNINAVNSSQNSALHVAAINGYLDICKYLIEEAKPLKADVLIKGLYDQTPREAAENHGKEEVAQYLQGHEEKMINWENRNCLLKLCLNRKKTVLFKGFTVGIFKEIIKYA